MYVRKNCYILYHLPAVLGVDVEGGRTDRQVSPLPVKKSRSAPAKGVDKIERIPINKCRYFFLFKNLNYKYNNNSILSHSVFENITIINGILTTVTS